MKQNPDDVHVMHSSPAVALHVGRTSGAVVVSRGSSSTAWLCDTYSGQVDGLLEAQRISIVDDSSMEQGQAGFCMEISASLVEILSAVNK